MSRDDASLTELAAAVLDGSAVDWEVAESGPAALLPLLKQLKVVATVAEVHRSGAASDPLPREPMKQWGHFSLLERVGHGSFGEVYRAWNTRLEREVALKLLPLDPGSDDRAASSIIHEGRLLARVRHPNVVTIYDAQQIEGHVGLWMEFVRGNTLAQLVEKGRIFTAAETVRIGVELCSAVAAVHRAGLLHQDIKAGNVMLAEDGRVVLMDFGTGRELADGSDSALAGTPLYLAPELLRGEKATVQSEIYSIGVLLFHLLTRSYPVPARSLSELRQAHEARDTSSLSTTGLDIPPKLAAIINRAIDPQPSRRYESAEVLADELRASESEAIERRRQLGFVAVALVAIALGLFFVRQRFVSSSSGGPRDSVASASSGRADGPTLVETNRLTQSGQAVNAGISPDGTFVVYDVDQTGRSSLWLRQLATDTSRQIVPPAEVRYWQPTISPDGRWLYFMRSKREESRLALYRMPVTGGAPATLIHEHPDLQGALALSPDGSQVALIQTSRARGESEVIVIDVDGSGERKLARRKHPVRFGPVAWSPDGLRLAAVAGNADAGARNTNVVSLSLSDGAERAITIQPMTLIGDLAWLADGSGLLMVAADVPPRPHQIWHLSYPDGATHQLTDDANGFSGLSLRSDSTALVTSQKRRRRTLWVAPVHTAGNPSAVGSVRIETARARQITSGYIRLCWTPDGQIVYGSLASGTRNLWRANSDGTNPRQLTTVGLNTDPDVSPDGRVIVFTSIRGDSIHIWRMDSDGANPQQLTNGEGESKPRVTPDGLSLVYNSTTDWTLWRMPLAGGESVRLTRTFAREPAVSPDGSLIAYNFHDRQASPQWKIALIPANGGTPLKVFDRQRAEYQTFELNWTPDGRAITY